MVLQEFAARQLLERRFSLVLDGDTCSRLTQPAFAIGASLAGIIENGRIKFNKFSRIRLIFDLANMYQEATDTELDVFCALNCLEVGDSDAFKAKADQKMRKLNHAISERKTLEKYTPAQIYTANKSKGYQ